MSEVTLEQILSSREARSKKQKELLKNYLLPVISFTMNIAGPVKNSPLIERAFRYGINRIYESTDKIIYSDINSYSTGCEAFFCVDMEADKLKKLCESIEDESSLGRLFDIDVIDTDGNKLSRVAERGCIICGAPGKACAAGRLHTVEELQSKTNRIMHKFFASYDKEKCASFAVESLIKEVKTTPKPGLVDLRNNGSHRDMNVDTFIKSANSLRSYFAECFNIGRCTKTLPCEDAFSVLKITGQVAEETMYRTTNGVNTHKGIIFSLGLLCAAIGRLWTPDKPFDDIFNITCTASDISGDSIRSDFENMSTETAGGRLYKKYGIKGIRGEVLSCFLTVVNHSLPTFSQALNDGMSENDAGVLALIGLISMLDDTNLYHRGGVLGAEFAKKYAKTLLNEKSPYFIKKVEQMDDEFIKRNLSPGGCADLLAITYFLYKIKKHSD